MPILVVDDETEGLKLLANVLVEEGFCVRAADRGELALASISVEHPELILLDIRMPGMDGFEVLRRLQGNAETRTIPVILLSCSSDLSNRLEGFRLGAVDFIDKPFQRDELLARVRTHLELTRLRLQIERRVEERTAELRESEERFRLMADAAPVMVWVAGTDKLCTFFNRGWLDFTGRSIEQELGNGWSDGVHPEDLERCCETYHSSFDSRRSFEMEYRLRRADGEYRWVFDRGVPRYSPGGVFAGYIGSCFDITDLKQSHEKMLASQKLESLGLMAAGVAHDFGNMLGTILAETDLALSDIAPDAPGRENLEKIASVVTHAVEIVRMLMASAGSRSDSATFGPVDLSYEVDQMLRLLRASISKGAAVRVSLPRHLPPVWGNLAQIHQVVINLVRNASDALRDQPGHITVSTESVQLGASGESNFSDLPNGDYVCLKVADTGCGMNAATRARIFDQFFTTKPAGRGLGLAAVHGIVRSHGGAIRVTSAPGAGAVFEILFPAARQEKHVAVAAVN